MLFFRLMMGMIGFTVGFIGFLLHNVVDCIEEPILERSLGYGWIPCYIQWYLTTQVNFTIQTLLKSWNQKTFENFQPWYIEFAETGNIALAWLWRTGIGIILGSVAAVIIVYFRPSAGGSGIPELIAFLNGTSIRHIYNVRTLLAKFISCAFAVSSGIKLTDSEPSALFQVSSLDLKVLWFTSVLWLEQVSASSSPIVWVLK